MCCLTAAQFASQTSGAAHPAVPEPLYPQPYIHSNPLLSLELPWILPGMELDLGALPSSWAQGRAQPCLVPAGSQHLPLPCSQGDAQPLWKSLHRNEIISWLHPALCCSADGWGLFSSPAQVLGSPQIPHCTLWGWGWLIWWLCERHSCLWLGFVSRRFCWTILC